MRWRSRFALGALAFLPTIGISSAVLARDAHIASRRVESIERSAIAQHSTDAAVTPLDSNSRQQAPTARSVYGDLPTPGGLTLGVWVLVGIAAALASSVKSRLIARGRAPPLRFL